MKNDVEEHTILFHNRGREIFFSLYKELKHSVTGMDRQRDENVFQQLQAKYINELKTRLHVIASELLGQTAYGLRNGFNRVLSSSIEEYTNEFTQKVRSL